MLDFYGGKKMNLAAEFIMELNVECVKELDVGRGLNGHLKVIGIVGGTFTGKLSGIIIPGGADWNTQKQGNIGHVFAKYLIQTNDGEYIAIENSGVIDFADNASTIKTTPRFTADHNGKYGWLNEGVYVASLQGSEVPNSVNIKVYKML